MVRTFLIHFKYVFNHSTGFLDIFGNLSVKVFKNFLQWKETDGSQLMDSKLKCVFVMPDNIGVTANGAASSVDHAKQDYHPVSSSVPAPPKPSLAASSSPKVG